MKIISHRGNIKGPEPLTENTPGKIDSVIELGYDVEIDVWFIDDRFYLGHDKPTTLIEKSFLLERSKFLWVHCKNISCLSKLRFFDFNYFFHDQDAVTLTSKCFIWTYPGVQEFYPKQVCLDFSPNVDFKFYRSKHITGLCVDYIEGT